MKTRLLSKRLHEKHDCGEVVTTADAIDAALLEAELKGAKTQLAVFEAANGGTKPPHRKSKRGDVFASDALLDAVEEAVSTQTTGMLCPAARAWSVCQIINRLRRAEARLAALEARVADLQGVSDANDTLAVALDQERRHSAEVLSQRNQAIDHVRRLHAQVADAAQLLGSISLTHPHLVPAEWAECGPEAKP